MKDENEIESSKIGPKSIMVSVQAAFGIVVTTLVVVLGTAITSSWWAAGISTQLGIVVKQTSDLGLRQTADQVAAQTRLTALELWQRQIDAVGSPVLNKKLDEQSSIVQTLRRDFDIYKATETKKP